MDSDLTALEIKRAAGAARHDMRLSPDSPQRGREMRGLARKLQAWLREN